MAFRTLPFLALVRTALAECGGGASCAATPVTGGASLLQRRSLPADSFQADDDDEGRYVGFSLLQVGDPSGILPGSFLEEAVATPHCKSPQASSIKQSDKLGTCKEGKILASGTSCTPQCVAGYNPSVKSLSCDGTALTPPTFECVAAPCAAPKGIKHAAPAGTCAEGKLVESGGTCTGQCKTGYVAYLSGSLEAVLECEAGVFRPLNYTCVKPDPIPAPGFKRGIGIGVSRNQALDWSRYDHTKVGWWFDWQYNVTAHDGPFSAEVLASSNFVPMVHNSYSLGDNMSKIYEGSPYLMGFNEPYGPKTDMTPQAVTDAWPQLQAKANEIRKKLKTEVSILTPSLNPKDLTYAAEFLKLMTAAGNEFQYVLMDYYPCTALELKQGLDNMYALFKLPIWLKEFNCGDGSANAPMSSHLAYMKEALPMLEAHPHVVRYSWMASTAPANSPGADLISGVNDEMTEIGHYYNSAPAAVP